MDEKTERWNQAMAAHSAGGPEHLPSWVASRPLDDQLARAAGRLILAVAEFESVAQPLLRSSELRLLDQVRMIAATLPDEER